METTQTQGTHDSVANALVLRHSHPTLRTHGHLWRNDRVFSGSEVGIRFWTALQVICMLCPIVEQVPQTGMGLGLGLLADDSHPHRGPVRPIPRFLHSLRQQVSQLLLHFCVLCLAVDEFMDHQPTLME